MTTYTPGTCLRCPFGKYVEPLVTRTRRSPGIDRDAVVAYILNLNGLIPADAEMSARDLPRVRMPNRDGFVSFYPTPVK